MTDFDLFLTLEDFKLLLGEMGYQIDDTGVVIDKETSLPAKSAKGEEVNIKEEGLALLRTRSHVFSRNIAEFSYVLTEKGVLQYDEK